MDFDLSAPSGGMPKRAPTQAKTLISVRCEYEDGSILELPVEDQQGFHRITDHVGGGKALTIHEIFITYGR